jgi:Ca-activated chloride channel family protein
MNAKPVFFALMIAAILLSACAGKAPTSVVVVEKEVVRTIQVEKPAGETSGGAAPQPLVYATQAQEVQDLPAPQVPAPQMPAATPAGVEFQNYGVNPYVNTFQDHLSTFSLDVDTASYTVMRNYIQNGSLPPADGIRVEEFVNYFKQDYPIPPDVAFGIYADGAPSPFATDGSYLLRFGVQGYTVPEWQRKPAVLTFLIDVSGSMQMNNRLGLVKDSLALLVERLRPDDTVSIVVYGSDARVVLEPVSGNQQGVILNAINGLANEGATNAEAGLILAYETAMRSFRPEANNRVILCSDGVANVGATGPDAILAKVRGYVEEGVYLSTFGVGMGNFNDVLLEQLANDGNGTYAYIDDMDEARRQFVDNLTSTLQVIALDAKVQVDFNSDVVAYYRLVGYENRTVADQDFRNDTVDAGEIGAGHSATAVYSVVLNPGTEGRIATVQMRWEDPDSHEIREINGNFNSWDLAASFYKTSPRYQLTMLAAQYAEILRQSPWAANSNLAQLSNMAAELSYNLPQDQDVSEFISLLQRAAQFAR